MDAVEDETSNGADVAPTEEVASEAPVFRLSLPWRVVEGPEFFTVHDPMLKEICRIPKTVKAADAVAQYLTAFPWALIALKHTFELLKVAEARKDGTTLRQWLRNHEGAQCLEQLEHAISVAFDPEAGNTPPRSYGLRLSRPKTALPASGPSKSFRDMLEKK